jgi:hypothetical protein
VNLEQVWDECFLEEIARKEKDTGTNPVDWRAGGRATKANPDKENKAWWDVNGKQMFINFVAAWKLCGFKVWMSPENVPGIEISLNASFGDIPIKAFADAVIVTPEGDVAVVDFKTGSYIPSSSLQLGIYASLMEILFGIRPTRGFFYDARKAVFTEVYGLSRWSIPVLTELFSKFETAIQNEIFIPNVGMSCITCGVRDYCYAAGGELSEIYDPLALTNNKPKEKKGKTK